jgi:hypothetical protein
VSFAIKTRPAGGGEQAGGVMIGATRIGWVTITLSPPATARYALFGSMKSDTTKTREEVGGGEGRRPG